MVYITRRTCTPVTPHQTCYSGPTALASCVAPNANLVPSQAFAVHVAGSDSGISPSHILLFLSIYCTIVGFI